jgi:hypothetical protein
MREQQAKMAYETYVSKLGTLTKQGIPWESVDSRIQVAWRAVVEALMKTTDSNV